MNTLTDIFSERMARARAEGQRAAQLFEHEFGVIVPQAAFPATLTGIAHPMPGQREREFANSPLKASLPSCTDPERLEDCFDLTAIGTPNQYGFYADEYLPCGVAPVRYRWTAPEIGIHSEGCGYRTKENVMVPWRQAFYAVNVSHGSADGSMTYQDRNLDYGPVPNAVNPNSYPFLPAYRGLPVIMAWGYIGNLTNDTPTFGFFFTHMTDAIGIGVCRQQTPPQGAIPYCCYYIDGVIVCVTVYGTSFSDALVQCQSFGQFNRLTTNCTC